MSPARGRAVAGGRELVRPVEQLAERVGQRMDVARGHDAARAEAPDDLAEPADVVDDRGHARAERLQERARLVELVPVREDRDRRLRERPLELGSAEIAEPPFGPLAAARRSSSSGIRGSPATRSRAPSTPSDGLDRVRRPL